MAKTRTNYTFPARQVTPPKYPWHEWLNGEVWELRQGEDFTCQPASIQTYARVRASEAGGRVRTVIEDGTTVILQFVASKTNTERLDPFAA